MPEKKISSILMEMAFIDEPPSLDTELKDDLGIDSLRIAELIIELENEFDILIDESDLDPEKMKTVKDIYDLVNNYVEV